ncbi:MAG: CAP domain-containing protein [Gemmataceae bacterium]
MLPSAPGGAATGWHVGRVGKKAGPMAWADLLSLAGDAKIKPDDMILAPRSPKWVRASQIHGLLTPTVAKPVPVAALAPKALTAVLPPPSAAIPLARPTKRTRNRWMVFAGVSASVLLIGVGTWLALRKPAEKSQPSPEIVEAQTQEGAKKQPKGEAAPPKKPPQKENSSKEPPPDVRKSDTKTLAPKEAAPAGFKKLDLSGIHTEFLDTLNRYRRQSGLGQVAFDPLLTKGCQAHAEYLGLNLDRPETKSAEGVQSENNKLPGYSAEGKRAAEAGMTVLAEPDVALEIFMGRLLSRTPLLNPELKRVGLGVTCTEGGDWVCVVDPTRGMGDYLIPYPAPDQADVPPSFTGGPEWPNLKKAAGYPITMIFPPARKISQAEIKLVDAAGTQLAAKPWTPEKPLIGNYRYNLVGLIPEKPLVAGAKHTVQFSARVDDQVVTKFWNFTVEDDSDSSGAVTQQVLDRVNQIRKTAGLAPVTLDPDLHRGCRNHARYLVLNANHPATAGLGAHDEDMTLPGATAEGKDAGKKAVIALGDHDPRDAVDGWMATLYHRIPILEPNLKQVGFGLARGDRLGWITVLNLMSGKTRGRPHEVLYPVPDQSDVPLHFPPGGEVPDPIPEDKDKKAGYPITLFFPYESPLVGATGRLEDGDGNRVDVWFSSPDKHANPKYDKHQGNTVCLIPKDPLKAKTKYVVHVLGTRSGTKWEKTWSFTTSDASIANGPKTVVDRINEYRRKANVPEATLDDALSKGCQAHAEYLARNGDQRDKSGFDVNDESPKLPGFSELGQNAARRTDIFLSAPRPTVQIDDLMGTISRRAYLLDPALRRVGVGAAQEPGRGWVTVLDVHSGRGEAGATLFSLYPAPGQQDVPLKGFDRLPDAKDQFAGYPISAIFPRSAVIKNVRATLADRNGKTLDIFLSTPENPLDAGLQYHAVGIHPRRPLEAGQIYTVTLIADVSSQAFQQSWRFETMAK